MICSRIVRCCFGLAVAQLLLTGTEARAELVLSQMVVELQSNRQSRADIEVLNTGPDRAFVSVEPREILGAGTGSETSRTDVDPEKLGLLVSPARMILEAKQHKLLRVAFIGSGGRERVYRVTVRPVAGELSSPSSGLKVLVGYDVLVLVRPEQLNPHVTGMRAGQQLTIRNDGNVSVELVGGKECGGTAGECRPLPGGRLYVGAERSFRVTGSAKVSFDMKVGDNVRAVKF